MLLDISCSLKKWHNRDPYRAAIHLFDICESGIWFNCVVSFLIEHSFAMLEKNVPILRHDRYIYIYYILIYYYHIILYIMCIACLFIYWNLHVYTFWCSIAIGAYIAPAIVINNSKYTIRFQ